KATADQIPEPLITLVDYFSYWHGLKGGYSGVSLHLLRDRFPRPDFGHPSFDVESRIVTARLEAAGETPLEVASIYVPNGGKDYAAKLRFMRSLEAYVAERIAAFSTDPAGGEL